MSYQTQKQPEYAGNPFEESEETAVSAPAPKNKMTPGLRVTLIILLCAAFFFTGVSLRYRTNDPFAVSADPGYLSLPEFVLRDYETGEPVQENSLSGFTDKYTYTFSVYNYETSRGIRIGDSWNAFVDAYGDTYINEVSVDGTLFPLDSPMTLQEFHDSCVLGGEVSPYNSEVEITFMTGTDGKNLCYTEMDLLRARDSYAHTPGIMKPVLGEDRRPSRFWLSFQFVPTYEGNSELDFIYSGQRTQY